MKKTGIKTAALALIAAVIAPSFGACENESDAGKAEIWSTYNTLKTERNIYDYPKGEAKIGVDMAIGETEGAQIVFTPEKDAESFSLKAGELKCGDEIFPAGNVKIYVQKYLDVKLKTSQQKNDKYPAGFIPDMLLPMETAEEYGENRSGAGDNQGLFVEFTAPVGTKSGNYTGVFTLTINGAATEIPVSVNVRNVTVEHSYGKNSFGLYQNLLMNGELDSSDEMYETYYSWLLKEYKVCLMHVPNALELDKFAASVKKYYDEPGFTSFGIPTFGSGSFDAAAFNDFVYEIAKICTPEKMYLEKAYVYPLMADEPHNATKRRLMNEVRETRDALDRVIINRLDEAGFFDEYGGKQGEFAEKMAETLRNLPCVITTDGIEEFGDQVDTYCPTVEYFATEYLRGLYKDHESRHSGETWFYTAMNPLYPYPSHHIDDYLIGSRSMRWMQSAYDLEGYLYWNISYYTETSDNYNDPSHFFSSGGAPFNGDGFMTYPGVKYGSSSPFPSLRLVSLRDGQEDYDLLRMYKEKFGAMYGGAADANDVFAGEYEAVFAGAIYNPDDEAFLKARTSLLDKSEALASATGLAAYRAGGGKKIEIFAESGSEISVNGAKIAVTDNGNYVKATFESETEAEVKAVKNGETATLKISAAENTKNAALTESALQMSDGSEAKLSDGELELTVRGKGGTTLEINSFKPGFYVDQSLFGGSAANLQSITMVVENAESAAYAVQIVMPLKDGTNVTLEKYTLKPGVNEIKITGIPLHYAHRNSKPERLRVIFPNVEGGEVVAERKVILKSVSYTSVKA